MSKSKKVVASIDQEMQIAVTELFNPDFIVTDKRQDPGYGYDNIWLLELTSKSNSNYKLAAIVNMAKAKNKDYEAFMDASDLEAGKTIWDIPTSQCGDLFI